MALNDDLGGFVSRAPACSTIVEALPRFPSILYSFVQSMSPLQPLRCNGLAEAVCLKGAISVVSAAFLLLSMLRRGLQASVQC